MNKRFFEFVRRCWLKPPHVILRWIARYIVVELRQPIDQRQAKKLSIIKVLKLLDANNLNDLWLELGNADFPLQVGRISIDDYNLACPEDYKRIETAANNVLQHKVNLLGSGTINLGNHISWHKDFKSGYTWPNISSRRIKIMDLNTSSDIKVPWELSRLQWLIPAGQAFLINGDERYSEKVKNIIKDWDTSNPLGWGVNWACNMEVALRSITLIWLFKVFYKSAAWKDEKFRSVFLKLLYLHGKFIFSNLEWSDINSNHLTTNAVGLVFIGLFFMQGEEPNSWSSRGWNILNSELPKQVFQDGVNFEGSIAYHRLVTELFLLPALYRKSIGLEVKESYVNRLRKMAEFIKTYSRTDGSSPLWGDADDGRTIPFGGQGINDHRYLISIIGLYFGDNNLRAEPTKSAAEIFWVLGLDAILKAKSNAKEPSSKAFHNAGVFILREKDDLVFINCGPVGMSGRGGHGHNDCLSFEASLQGQSLITDCGSYVYSADYKSRNNFRSTSFHNTPIIDDEEQNRFVHPEFLWTFYDDAKPKVHLWSSNGDMDHFVGAHTGYHRLHTPVTPVRSITLEKTSHSIIIFDRFEGAGKHKIQIPYHLSLGLDVIEDGHGLWKIIAEKQEFIMIADITNNWTTEINNGLVSLSYGKKHPIKVINFYRDGPLNSLSVAMMPAKNAPTNPVKWLRKISADLNSVSSTKN
ncbi:MAG: alginate lyase family protein [Pseudomonadota bacterium]|nr:alginate lyase family protein [Pseudomonadota bacterium]